MKKKDGTPDNRAINNSAKSQPTKKKQIGTLDYVLQEK
jgi:hypothetical protein